MQHLVFGRRRGRPRSEDYEEIPDRPVIYDPLVPYEDPDAVEDTGLLGPDGQPIYRPTYTPMGFFPLEE